MKMKIVWFGLAAAAFFSIALLVAGAAMSGDGGLADDRIVDMSVSEGGSGDALGASSVTSSINYQGRLTDSSGNPLNGTYTLTFKLYETTTGGTALATDTHAVTVTDGLFSTTINLGTSSFDGRALWLGIKVGSDPEMTPRQELRPVPYALGLRPDVEINGSVTGPILEVTNSKVNPLLALQAGTGISAKTFGPWGTAVIAKTYGNQGTGVWAGTEGDHSDGVSVVTEGLESEGFIAHTHGNLSDGVYAYTTGYNAIGTIAKTEGDYSSGVWTETFGDYSYGVYAYTHGTSPAVYAYSDKDMGVVGMSNRSTGGEFPGGGTGVYGEARGDTTDGTGVKGVGARGVWGDGTYTGVYGEGTYTGVYGKSAGYAGEFRGNLLIRSYSTGTPVVELGEGLDYAEGFDVSGPQNVEPGSVLCIDPLNPGLLTVCDLPYDRKVAGIVTGAQGLGSGVRLGSDMFDYDVALAGRVYCNVDASETAVEPGDLLTTSATAGYAMKVTEYECAQGAILGKAMEPLEKGEKGQILVLVTLQ